METATTATTITRGHANSTVSRNYQDVDVAVISCPYLIARLLLATTLGGRHPSRSESVVLKRSHASLANSKSVSFPLCAFFSGGRFVGPLRWLIDHRQTMESCSLNRLPLRFQQPNILDSRGSRVVFVLFTWSCRARMRTDG